MSGRAAREERRRRDRELIARYDPYGDREIELKLGVDGPADPFELLTDIEAKLNTTRFSPFVIDPFTVAYTKFTLHAFGFVAGHDVTEAFMVVNDHEQYSIREKSAPTPVSGTGGTGGLEGFVIDRHEEEKTIRAMSVEDFIGFIEVKSRHGTTPIQYLGSFSKEARGIACRHTESGHRYALVADRSVRPGRADLRQLELEYIWKREDPGRRFTKDEIYRDIADFSQRLIDHYGTAGLAPTRLTKFEWLTRGA